jgi:divalent metal cation (Fe/Co/Zn/Cd) transporter
MDAHEIADRIEQDILHRLPDAEVLIHLDPYDDSAENAKRAVPLRKGMRK